MVAVKRFTPSFFGEHDQIARKLADRSGNVTIAALKAAEAVEGDDATRAAIKDMIARAQQDIPQDAVKAGNLSEIVTALPTPSMASMEPVSDEAIQNSKAMQVLGRYVIGQEPTKVFVSRVIEAQETGLLDGPKCIAIAGPPGVGKTETARGVSAAVTGNADCPLLVVEGNKITDDASLRRYTGAPPSFIGYVKPEEDKLNPMSQYMVQQKFGDGPIVILLDEVDKIGMGHPRQADIKSAFWNSFGSFLQDGIFRYENGGEYNFCRTSDGKRRPVYVVITSNAGQGKAGGLPRGPALRQHYVKAMQDDIRASAPHLIRRVKNFVAADPLEPNETKAITEKVLNEAFKMAKKIAREAGKEIELSVSDRTTELLGHLGLSAETGAGMLQNIVESLLIPKIGEMARFKAQDEEHWELDLTIDPRSPADSGHLEQIRADFAHAGAHLGAVVPEQYTADNFPVDFSRKNPKPQFYPYQGTIEHLPGYELKITSTGVLGRFPFLVSNAGRADSEWKLQLLKPGATEDLDRTIDAPGELPKELRSANVAVQAAAIDENRLFLYGVNAPEKGAEPETFGYVYNLRGKVFDKCEAKLPALFDMNIGAIDGKIVFAGGRELKRNEFDEWTFDPARSLADMSGEPISGKAWVYDPEVDKLTEVAAGMSVPRIKSMPVENGGKLWYAGGIQNTSNSDGVPYSASSTAVETFDPKAMKFERSQYELPSDLGAASAFNDKYGRMQLAGGKTLSEVGRQVEDRQTLFRLDPRSENPKWRTQDDIPALGSELAAIPHPSGRVLGPFFDEEGAVSFQILR